MHRKPPAIIAQHLPFAFQGEGHLVRRGNPKDNRHIVIDLEDVDSRIGLVEDRGAALRWGEEAWWRLETGWRLETDEAKTGEAD